MSLSRLLDLIHDDTCPAFALLRRRTLAAITTPSRC